MTTKLAPKDRVSDSDANRCPLNPFLAPILDRCSEHPGALFGSFLCSDAWKRLTLGQIVDRAQRFAELYRNRGAGSGDKIMLVIQNSPDAYAAFLGAMLAGAVPSFLPSPSSKQDHALYWKQHRTLLKFCRPRIVMISAQLQEDMLECAENSGASIVTFSEVGAATTSAVTCEVPEADAVGLLQHSSGTTGLKKGVELSYRSIALQLASYRDALLIDQSSKIISWLPLYHDMGLISSFLLPVWLGIPIISIDPFLWVSSPELMLSAIEEHGATHAWMPNFAFMYLARRIAKRRAYDLHSLRALISCSEPCKPEAFDTFQERFAAWGLRREVLQTCYAMAETVFAVSQSDVTRPVRRLTINRHSVSHLGRVELPEKPADGLTLLSNGRPINGCAVGVRRDGEFLDEMEIGEICVSAEFMFSGYYKNPTATADAFVDAWYCTGDLGFIQQGEIFIVGRVKDVIIVNGKNVFAHDVELALASISGIKPGRCVALGHYAEKMGSEQLVIVAERDGGVLDDDDIQREINRAVVEEIGIPCNDIRLVDPGWLIKTTSGKISRTENATKYAIAFLA